MLMIKNIGAIDSMSFEERIFKGKDTLFDLLCFCRAIEMDNLGTLLLLLLLLLLSLSVLLFLVFV